MPIFIGAAAFAVLSSLGFKHLNSQRRQRVLRMLNEFSSLSAVMVRVTSTVEAARTMMVLIDMHDRQQPYSPPPSGAEIIER